MTAFSENELIELKEARALLENTSMTAWLSGMIGKPIDRGFDLLPDGWKGRVSNATKIAMLKGLEFSIYTLGEARAGESKDTFHKLMSTASGVAGGMFGLFALPVELPFSTCLILRSVADIAQHEGHEISQVEVRLSCLEVFALGGEKSTGSPDMNGYWQTRSELAAALRGAAHYIARNGLIDSGAPPIIRFLLSLSSRFGVFVSEQVAAQALPVVGALGGGVLNYLFITHFQNMARGHFVIKRLEKKYGSREVQKEYFQLAGC